MVWEKIIGIGAVVVIALFVLARIAAQLIMFPAGPSIFGSIAQHRPNINIYSKNGMRYLEYMPINARALVFVFHGNGGIADHRLDYVDRLQDLEYGVIVPEYPGYGGDICLLSESVIVDNMCQIVHHVKSCHNPIPIIFIGRSMGTAVATMVCDRIGGVNKMVLVSPFPSIQHIAERMVPTFIHGLLPLILPAQFICENVASLISCPITILAAEHDSLIPSAMSKAHALNFPNMVQFVNIEGVGHNDMHIVRPNVYWSAIRNGIK